MIRRLLLTLLILTAQSVIFFQVSDIIWQDKFIELKSRLREISFEQKNDSIINITGRLKLIQNRIDSGENPIENYQYEAKIQSLSSGVNLYQELPDNAEETGKKGSQLTSVIRFLLRREKPVPREEPSYFSDLEEAYFRERNRQYNLAVLKYNELVAGYSHILENNILNTILLHLSFSHLMNADYAEAGDIAAEVISQSSNIAFRSTADRIQIFIESLQNRQQNLNQLKKDSLELGRELYFSVKYDDAINTLDNYLKASDNRVKNAEARYYKGRALEELGQVDLSIMEYQRILVLSEDPNLRREANRRLLMLNSFYDITNSQAEILDETLQGYIDTELNEVIEPFQEMYIEVENFPGPVVLTENSTAETPFEKTGEVYITTNPPGARISINTVYFGISPLFITSLPIGSVWITAEYEKMKAEESVNISSRIIKRVEIELREKISLPVEKRISPGRLKIIHQLTDIEFKLDYEPLKYSKGQLLELPPGEYILMAEGTDITGQLLFWEGVIVIEDGILKEISIP